MPAGSVSRSDTEQSLASHEKRIRDLEWTGDDEVLRVTDGIVSVKPTHEIDVGSGLVLTNPAAGVAAIEAAPPPALVYARCEAASGGGGFPAGPIPFTTDDSNGVTVGADSWTIVQTGLYLINALAIMQIQGLATPTLASQPSLIFGFVVSGMVGPPSGQFGWSFPVTIPAGQYWEIAPAVNKMVRLPAAAVVTFQVASLLGTPVFAFGSWSMEKVG